MGRKININGDLGESFGRFQIGNDAALMESIGTANIACGFHGGDPNTMHHAISIARSRGVSVGAHPGFNDLWGFGRREIKMSTDEVERFVTYQIGAFDAMARSAGASMTHVKPHGALMVMAAKDFDLARAIGRAIKTFNKDLIYVGFAKTEVERAAKSLDLPFAMEAYADRIYDDNGALAPRTVPNSIIVEPERAVEHVLRMLEEGALISRSGQRLKTDIHSFCVHGDEPSAPAVAKAVKAALQKAGFDVVPLIDMMSVLT